MFAVQLPHKSEGFFWDFLEAELTASSKVADLRFFWKCRTSLVRKYFSKDKIWIFTLVFQSFIQAIQTFVYAFQSGVCSMVAEMASKMQRHLDTYNNVYYTKTARENNTMCFNSSLIPRPPPFFVLWFRKWGRPGNEATSILCSSVGLNSFLSPDHSKLCWQLS